MVLPFRNVHLIKKTHFFDSAQKLYVIDSYQKNKEKVKLVVITKEYTTAQNTIQTIQCNERQSKAKAKAKFG